MPEQPTIQAAIRNHEMTMVILKDDGTLPECDYEKGHGSFEDTLSLIGHKALANVPYVSVDHRFSHDGKMLYQTKPVPEGAEPAEGHSWGLPPESIVLK